MEVSFCTFMKAMVGKKAKWSVYLGEQTYDMLSTLVTDLLSFTILFNYVVPISLYVTIGN